MKVTAIIRASHEETHLEERFSYDYNGAKANFLKKMCAEVAQQMGKKLLPFQMEALLKQSQPERVLEFSVSADWLADNLETIKAAFQALESDEVVYCVEAFELEREDGTRKTLNAEDEVLGPIFRQLNDDFNTRI